MLVKKVKKVLQEATQAAYPEINEPIEITEATQDKFGHYQCNSAMKLAKLLKKAPREVAEGIVKEIKDSIFDKIEIAGPGFINLTVNKEYLAKSVNEILKAPHLGVEPPKTPETILVEFSSPNVAKEMHVGHLRSTIIGEAIARLFEFLGYKVLRINHIGDWGTAFGMLIAYMQQETPEILNGQKPADLPTLMHLYKASKKRFDEDEAFKTKARNAVVALQGGDPAILKAWELICDISRKGYSEVYSLLDVKIKEMGESFYNPMLPDVVADLDKKGLVTISEGAKCVFHEGYPIPLMVQKTDGGYNYDTTDVAAMKYRVESLHADRIIVITDSGQSLHFKLVYETVVKAGYLDPKKVRFDHVTFGLVLGADGKKFKTRSGDTEKLLDLLTEGINEAKKILIERDKNIADIDQLAKTLGIAAIKYADLSYNRSSDYVFSYEKMLKFEGNTATFILYSYVRVNGIKRKINNADIKSLLQNAVIVLTHPSEIDLGLTLARFSETLENFAQDLYPHHLTDYLYTLANKFNAFFRDCQVVGSHEQDSRLLLCEATAEVMKTGLNILGIDVVERM